MHDHDPDETGNWWCFLEAERQHCIISTNISPVTLRKHMFIPYQKVQIGNDQEKAQLD